MSFYFDKNSKDPSIHCKDNIVYKASNEFVKLTGYRDDEIIGKTIEELGDLLKFNFKICFDNKDISYKCYLFMKMDRPVEVEITREYMPKEKTKVYFIQEVDNPTLNNILEDIFNLNLDDEKSIALYSLDNSILLQSNSHYIDKISLLSLPTDDLIGKPPILKELLLDSTNSGNYNHRKEVEFKNKQGSSVYFDLSTMPLYIDGKEKYLLNIIYDVTDKVLSRIDLEKQNEYLKLILDKVSDKIGIINNQGDYIYTNESCHNIIKSVFSENDIKSPKKIYGKVKFYDLKGIEIPFEYIPSQRVLRGEEFSNYIVLGTSNNLTQYHNCLGIPLYDKQGNIDGGILMYENITDKIILEEYNAFKEKTENSFLNYASLSYPDFKILYINEEGYKTIKNSCPFITDQLSLIGKPFFKFSGLTEEEQSNEIKMIKQFVEGKSSSYSHTQRIENNGKSKYIKTLFQPIYNQHKEINKISFLGIDVTKEEKANEQMTKVLKIHNEAFINSSHELRTPLSLIFSASQLLDMYLKKDDFKNIKNEIAYYNQIIIKNCHRLTKLINNILDVSKIEQGFYKLNLSNQDIVNITENIVQSFSTYAEDIGFRIIFDTNIEEKIIAIDLYNFERIMINLISNAIKYSIEEAVIFINLVYKDNYVEITVEDQGIGISQENLSHIFDKFFQVDKSLNRKSEGAGIGLALVKYLIQLHKGEIYVESTLGKGSMFTIKLPSILVEDKKVNNYISDDISISEIIKIELSDIIYKKK